MSIAQNFPEIRPSLNLDFANVKALDSRVTFARASTGAYYDGQTVAKAEENLLTYSQEFDAAGWAPTNTTVTADTTAAPDGTTTADTLTATATTGQHLLQRSVTIPAGTFTVSIFAKSGTTDFIQLTLGGFAGFANFDLSTGAVGTTSGLVSSSITLDANGFYRCSITFVNVSSSTFVVAITDSSTATRLNTWTALGTETVLIWGAQLEQRSAVTAYTPTTTQRITNYIPVLQTASANVARFDHNPATGESLGLLVEEQRTNLVIYSEQFDNGNWVKSQTTITSNTIVAPDSTLTGDKIVETSGAGLRQLYQTPSLSAVSHSFSAYFKASERYWFKLNLTGSGAYFDLSTGVIGTIDAGVTAAMTAVGNGWYRCSIVRTVLSGTNYTEIQLALTNGGGSYTGDGYSGIFIWGAQLEAGAFPTSYIPTVASQVTRSADNASMTGTNFSDWYRADEGTLCAEANTNNSNDVSVLAEIGSLVSNRFTIQPRSSGNLFFMVSNGANQVLIQDTNCYDGKFAYAVKTNDVAGAYNANISGSDVEAYLPQNVHTLGIGYSITQSAFWVNGHIKKLSYYPKRLTNEQLQALTS